MNASAIVTSAARFFGIFLIFYLCTPREIIHGPPPSFESDWPEAGEVGESMFANEGTGTGEEGEVDEERQIEAGREHLAKRGQPQLLGQHIHRRVVHILQG